MVPAAPRRDPLAVIAPLQAELAVLRWALVAPGPLSPADGVLAVEQVRTIAVSLRNLQRTVRRQEQEACHA